MSFQKFITNSYCIGKKIFSVTKNIVDEITFNEKTVREIILFGQCSIYNKKKSMTVSDNKIEAESLNDFFKTLGKSPVEVGKKIAKTYLKTLHEPWIQQQTLLLQLQVDLPKM